MKILIVTYPEPCCEKIHVYSARCTNDMLFDVEVALEELQLEVSTDVVEDIANEMLHSRNYWLDELFCFEVITV